METNTVLTTPRGLSYTTYCKSLSQNVCLVSAFSWYRKPLFISSCMLKLYLALLPLCPPFEVGICAEFFQGSKIKEIYLLWYLQPDLYWIWSWTAPGTNFICSHSFHMPLGIRDKIQISLPVTINLFSTT